MVSRWMEDRDAFTYIRRHGEIVDRRSMVGCPSGYDGSFFNLGATQVRRIAKGLEILHSHDPPIAHGHLKAVR